MNNCLLAGHLYSDSSSDSGTYGIKRDITNSSTSWTRTDDAIGLQTGASVLSGSVFIQPYSDFNKISPWKDMERVVLDSGDTMVKIPKFYYRRFRDGNEEHIQISVKQFTGSTLHPAFNRPSGAKDYIYVGAYETSSGHKSISGVSPLVSQTRAQFRSGAKSKGTGWSIIDISTVSAIQMLYLVEFANNNSQLCIGAGNTDNSAALSAGNANSVPNLTGSRGNNSSTAVVYRGIENFWGNVWELTDGLNFINGSYYICNDPSKYADDTTANYTALSYTGSTSWFRAYITEIGLDQNNSWCMMPSVAGSGNENSYYPDAVWSATGNCVFRHGHTWNGGSFVGIFAWDFADGSSYAYTTIGSRLLYIPN